MGHQTGSVREGSKMPVKMCPMAVQCPLFAIYPPSELNNLKKVYCVGEYRTCARLAIKQSGQVVPLRLLPDGSTFDEATADADRVYTVV